MGVRRPAQLAHRSPAALACSGPHNPDDRTPAQCTQHATPEGPGRGVASNTTPYTSCRIVSQLAHPVHLRVTLARDSSACTHEPRLPMYSTSRFVLQPRALCGLGHAARTAAMSECVDVVAVW
eukprot:1190391-Prymnesium_polylepis.1